MIAENGPLLYSCNAEQVLSVTASPREIKTLRRCVKEKTNNLSST